MDTAPDELCNEYDRATTAHGYVNPSPSTLCSPFPVFFMRRFVVRRSSVHGRGVFASTTIRSGESIIEYKGELTSWRSAFQRYQRSSAEAGHTFFFGLDDGRVIDGARAGNSARWINHSCEPNCEAAQQGSRVFIRALNKIATGAELFIDCRLDVEGRRTTALKKLYSCRCDARRCRGTMLAAR